MPRSSAPWYPAFIAVAAATLIFNNAWDGVTTLHEIKTPGNWRTAATLVYLAAASAGYYAAYRRKEQPLPAPVLPAVLALIVICGYLVSIPGEMHWNSQVLLAIYTAAILLSSGLCAAFWRRAHGA